MFRFRWRRAVNVIMLGFCVAFALLALAPLASILIYITTAGIGALDWNFLTKLPKAVGSVGGGMANAIFGTLVLVGVASLIALPTGLMAGIYLAEFGKGRLAGTVRFGADVLTGVPSIVVGIFVYIVLVMPMKTFSGLAGSVSLAIIMIPMVTRTTEEMLRLVPDSLREASLALGASQMQTTVRVVLPAAAGGIVTGVMLAIARAAGETAPLLFTALNSRYWPSGLLRPMASLPVTIFNYAISPFDDWHRQAWAGALVLIIMVLLANILARLATSRLGRLRR